ncbi:MAG: LLM class flavin-dependent oxidoreductase [Thermomicrobiales bacterium]
MDGNMSAWATHPWVAEAAARIRFGLIHPWLGTRLAWPEMQRWVDQVAALGFDSYWFSDHPLLKADCWTQIAALAATTQSIRLGTMVSCIYYRHPAVLARIVADVDRISQGRIVLGLGIGDSARVFAQLGLDFPPALVRQRALEEGIRIIRGVWGAAPLTFAGETFRVREAQVLPPPVQQPRVPILIAGAGERGTLRQVAAFADAANFGPHPDTGNVANADAARHKFAVLREHCARFGRPFDSILRTYWSPPIVLATSPRTLAAKRAAISPDEHRYYGAQMFVGTPEDAIAHFQQLVNAGYQYFIVHTRADPETTSLLAEQVIPALTMASPANSLPH